MRKSTRADSASTLFDLLADNPDGMTQDEINAVTGWARPRFMRTVQHLRDILAENGDTISVPCEPNGHLKQWVYRLTGGAQIADADSSRWLTNRITDAVRRLQTVANVAKVAVAATDGRSVLGRKARIIHLHAMRALEEVAMVDEEVSS